MANTVRPRIRVLHGTEIALGPGKIELLEAIERTGTLAEAARSLGMSYMRAWKLLQTMNACFRRPLVDTSRGGSAKRETFDPRDDLDQDETDTSTLGLNYYVKGHDLKLMLDYQRVDAGRLESQDKVLARLQVIF